MSYSDDYKGKDNQPYKYNGKELDEEHGLNWYDYSARYYDPIVPRFTSIDPMAEKYYSISPYAYVANNPLKYIDPTGMWTQISGGYTTSDPEEINRFVNQQKSIGSQIKEQFLNFLGIDPNEPTKEGAANVEKKKELEQNSENLTSALNTFNETVTSLFPGGIIGYKLYNDQEIAKSDIGWEVAGILPVGKVLGKGASFASKLFRAFNLPFKGGKLTHAGRAVTKHPEYFGFETTESLMKVYRTPSQINQLASSTIKDILRDGTMTMGRNKRYTDGWITFTLPDGRAATWNFNGGFIGFRGQ